MFEPRSDLKVPQKKRIHVVVVVEVEDSEDVLLNACQTDFEFRC